MHDSLIRYPDAFLWNFAVQLARKRNYQFSMRCEEYFKEQIKVGFEVNKVGLYEFSERLDEARANVAKLVDAMVADETANDPKSRLLSDSTMFNALYHHKLCPGLWPLC